MEEDGLAVRLQGNYTHKLDDKGRLILPSKFRDELGLSVAISFCIHIPTLTIDPCVAIYPMEEWETLQKKLEELPQDNNDMRYLVNLLRGNARDEEKVDKSGRILIPQHLRARVGVSTDVVVSGNGDHIEIWDAGKWNEFNDKLLGKYMVEKW
jgi:MraZ protein